jgi:hypothetical protein
MATRVNHQEPSSGPYVTFESEYNPQTPACWRGECSPHSTVSHPQHQSSSLLVMFQYPASREPRVACVVALRTHGATICVRRHRRNSGITQGQSVCSNRASHHTQTPPHTLPPTIGSCGKCLVASTAASADDCIPTCGWDKHNHHSGCVSAGRTVQHASGSCPASVLRGRVRPSCPEAC